MHQSQKMLLLQYSEVEELISKTRGDSYSDDDKAIYHSSLLTLFERIKNLELTSLNLTEIQEIRSYLRFIFNCLIFLRDSSLNSIPFEIVKCLTNAMGDWVNSNDFIIVTGLTKDLYDFSFFLDYTRNDFFYESIRIKFGVEFEKKLVQINLPITLCKDYISTVPLYHELGHFIEKQYDVATYAITDLINSGTYLHDDVKKYFPYITEPFIAGRDNQKIIQVFHTHIMEYFCDLFAAQYIGLTSNIYLNSISNNLTGGPSHPSTPNREAMVKDFLEGKSNIIIDKFDEILTKLANKPLKIRFSKIESNDFYDLIPFVAKNDEELHGIFNYGWMVWLEDFKPFSETLGNMESIPGGKIYQIINSLMEKSIGNYFITKEWNSNK